MNGLIIYGLLDPTTEELRYIGLTKRGMKRRMKDHLWEAKKGRITHLYNWIRNLDMPPKIVVLRECNTLRELLQAETETIAYYRSLGCKLTNLTDGGQGRSFSHTEETKLKISNAKKGQISPNKGRKFSGIVRKNMKAASLSRKNAIGRIKDHLGNIYDCPEDAAIKLGLKKYSIYQSLRDGRRLFGYAFMRLGV